MIILIIVSFVSVIIGFVLAAFINWFEIDNWWKHCPRCGHNYRNSGEVGPDYPVRKKKYSWDPIDGELKR